MKVIYDQVADTLTIIFTDTPVAESDEDKPGIILDYDAKGNLVSLEILDASQRVSVPNEVDFVILNGDEPLGISEFDTLIKQARQQAKEAGLKQKDINSAVPKSRLDKLANKAIKDYRAGKAKEL